MKVADFGHTFSLLFDIHPVLQWLRKHRPWRGVDTHFLNPLYMMHSFDTNAISTEFILCITATMQTPFLITS